MRFFRFGLLTLAGVLFLAPLLTSCLSVAAWAYLPLPEKEPATLATAADRFVVVEELTLRYRDTGTGRPLVLVHGFAGNLGTWDKLISALSALQEGAEVRVIALDLVGFGLSDKPARFDYGYASQGRVVAGFLEALGLNDVVLAGHSMGGNIALRTALLSSRVSKLALLDPGLINDGVPSFVTWAPWPYPRASARLFTLTGFRTSGLKGVFADPSLVTPSLVQGYLLAGQTKGYADAMVAMLRSYKPPTEAVLAPTFDRPVLLLWGELDKHNPVSNGVSLAATFPNARLEVLQGSGHYIQEERPTETAALLRAFVQEP